MTEIEIKARVSQREALIQKLNSFASFQGKCVREDTYYAMRNPDGTFSRKKLRIRKERTDSSSRILLTYKNKNFHTENGKSIEVNDEKECEISSPEALESFLSDYGFETALTKRKEVMDWTYDEATLELCTVDRLGDFLEVEILSESDSEEIRKEKHGKLVSIITMCGLSEKDLEEKTYSQLLDELSRENA